MAGGAESVVPGAREVVGCPGGSDHYRWIVRDEAQRGTYAAGCPGVSQLSYRRIEFLRADLKKFDQSYNN